MKLEELKKLCEEATKGPWEWQTSCSYRRIGALGRDGNVLRGVVQSDGHPDVYCSDADKAFIAAARTALPALIGAIENLIGAGTEMVEVLERRLSEDGRETKILPPMQALERLQGALAAAIQEAADGH